MNAGDHTTWVNSAGEYRSWTNPLLSATAYGHTEVVELLVNLGADVNVVDLDGRTALMEGRKERTKKE